MKWIARLAAGVAALTALAYAQATLKVTPAALTFAYQLGDAKLPTAGSLAVSVAGSTTPVSVTAAATGGPWLTVSPDTGKTPVTLKVAVNPTSLPLGTYSGTVTVTPAVGGPAAVAVPVTLTVKAPPASLTVTPNPLAVTYTRGGAALPSQFLSLSGNGALMSYTVAVSGATWITASPASGILFPGFTSVLTLTIDPTGLAPGTYKATVTVSAPSASNKTQAVPLNLTVNAGLPALASVWPARAVVGSGATTVTLSGTNFYPGSQVVANGSAIAATYLGSNSLQAVIPAAMLAAAGTIGIMVSNPNPGGGDSASVNFQALPPGPQILGITDGASFLPGSIAPGEMLAVFGSGIGPEALTPFVLPVAPATTLDTSLAGVRVLFDTIPAPLIFVYSTQVVVMAPYGLIPGSTIDVVVEFNGVQSAGYPVTVAATTPALFTVGSAGTGQAAAFNVDETTGALTLNADNAPVMKGGVISLYGTGAGLTNPAGVDGSIVATPAPIPVGTVSAKIGDLDATVLYAGGAPGLVDGMFQVNLRVPAGVASGKAIPVVVTVGAATSPVGVTISVK